MPSRIPWVLLSAILLPLIVFGQAQTPAEAAEQALRDRVTEFLQLHVEGNFRKAYDMVAEDTKDDYFSSGKVKLTGFKVDDVKLTDNLTKATVTATMSKMFNMQGQDVPITIASTTTWKTENGKWVWYKVPDISAQANMVGLLSAVPGLAATPAPAATVKTDEAGGGLPKDFSDKTIAAATQSILQQISVDKTTITLASDKASEDKVVFHNGMTGSVQLELSAPEIPGFTAKLGQSIVKGAGDVPVVFRYEPGGHADRRDSMDVLLTVQPLNQTFMIRVNFAAQGPSPLK
jgi:hypothetical protein